jgi:hypothetical protein
MASSSTNKQMDINNPIADLIPTNPHVFWISKTLSHTGIGYHAYYSNGPSNHEQPHPVYYN